VLDTAGYHPDAPSSTGLVVESREEAWHEQPYAADVTVPRLSTVWLVPVDEPSPQTIRVDASADHATITNGDPS